MSPNMSNDGDDEHRDKRVRRVRKGTRSCWECKRRKIRCIFAKENDPTCKGCLDRGTSCVSQEFLDDTERSNSNNAGLGHRLGRVEELLEKLITKVSPNNEKSMPADEEDNLPASASCLGIDVIVPTDEAHTEYGNAPIMSLFDNSVLSRTPAQQQVRQMPTPGSTASCSSVETSTKVDTVRRTLYRLLPSQADCDILTSRANEWWYLNKYASPCLEGGKAESDIAPISLDAVQTWHPTRIARLLLGLCLCVQQSSQVSQLKFLEMPTPYLWMEKCVTAIANLVTSDDELIGTVEGLECLILTGSFQINVGNLRRAWLNFRRALNIAQLMGLHRYPASKINRNPKMPLSQDDIQRSYVYYHLLKGDIYLTLLLGLPPAIVKDPFSGQPEGVYDGLSPEDAYIKHLCIIALRVIERNSSEESNAYAETQQIDEELESLKQSMPHSWWNLPTELEFMAMSSGDVAVEMDRILGQLWHYQIETLVHLPFMLRSVTDRRYDYSKICCLGACRESIRRFFLLRQREDQPFLCQIMDFQVFMSAIIILLGLMGPSSQGIADPNQRDQDRRMVDDLVKRLERGSIAYSNALGKQCADVLKTLISTDLHKLTGNLRVKIPYFGILTLVSGADIAHVDKRTPNTPALFPNEINNEPALRRAMWTGMSGMEQNMMPPPVLSFSSTQFPGLDELGIDGPPEWQFRESDIRVFDSLVNTDVEGNWDFGTL